MKQKVYVTMAEDMAKILGFSSDIDDSYRAMVLVIAGFMKALDVSKTDIMDKCITMAMDASSLVDGSYDGEGQIKH